MRVELCLASIQCVWLPRQPFSILPLCDTKGHHCHSLQHTEADRVTSPKLLTRPKVTFFGRFLNLLCQRTRIFHFSRSLRIKGMKVGDGPAAVRTDSSPPIAELVTRQQAVETEASVSGAAVWCFRRSFACLWTLQVVMSETKTRELPVNTDEPSSKPRSCHFVFKIRNWSILLHYTLKHFVHTCAYPVHMFSPRWVLGFWSRGHVGGADGGGVSGVGPAGRTVSYQILYTHTHEQQPVNMTGWNTINVHIVGFYRTAEDKGMFLLDLFHILIWETAPQKWDSIWKPFPPSHQSRQIRFFTA